MKITRTSQAALSAQQRSQLANAGCKVCPCCGETKSEMEYFKEGIYNKGVFGGLICSNGLRACLGLAICELTAIVALLAERNGKARRMK